MMGSPNNGQMVPKLPWYAGLFCRGRLRTAKILAAGLAGETAGLLNHLDLAAGDLPPDLREGSLTGLAFCALRRQDPEKVRDDLQVSLETGLRTLAATRMVEEIRKVAKEEVKNQALDFRDLPGDFKVESLRPRIFQELARQSAKVLQAQLLQELRQHLRDMRQQQLDWARNIVAQVGEEFKRLLLEYNLTPQELPQDLFSEEDLVDRAFRSLGGHLSADTVREVLLESLRPCLREVRVKKLHSLVLWKIASTPAKRLKMRLKEWLPLLFEQRGSLPSLFPPGLSLGLSGDTLLANKILPDIRPFLEISILAECSSGELSFLEEKLEQGDTVPGEVLDFLIQKWLMQLRRKSEEILDRLPNSQGGRESTCKGSIGHDRLNVRTQRPSEWRVRLAAVLGRARFTAYPAGSVSRQESKVMRESHEFAEI